MTIFRSTNLALLKTISVLIPLLFMLPSAHAQVCGDSEPDAGEQCDDGNLANGDGCDATCQVEAGFECSSAISGQTTENLLQNGSFEAGDTGWNQSGIPSLPICTPSTCGSGNDFSIEQLSGGWFRAGDAVSAASATASQIVNIPTDATTLELAIWPAACEPEGGNGDTITVAIDGNEVFNSATCNSSASYDIFPSIDLAIASGGPYNDNTPHVIAITGMMDFTPGDAGSGTIYVDNVVLSRPLNPPIPPNPSACIELFCGDGVTSAGEQCDDANLIDGDGCSSSCQIELPDSDGDGVTDDVDNCTLVANSAQIDSDADGFGNVCDADLNNDGVVNFIDLGIFRSVFFSNDADADFNGDGVVNFIDLAIIRGQFFQTPGPSGLIP